jgi:hypothetical protein
MTLRVSRRGGGVADSTAGCIKMGSLPKQTLKKALSPAGLIEGLAVAEGAGGCRAEAAGVEPFDASLPRPELKPFAQSV